MKKRITNKINKKAIKEKESIKYLGVLIDSTLSWKQQILNLSKKISRAIGIIYKLRPFFAFEGNAKCLLQLTVFSYYICD